MTATADASWPIFAIAERDRRCPSRKFVYRCTGCIERAKSELTLRLRSFFVAVERTESLDFLRRAFAQRPPQRAVACSWRSAPCGRRWTVEEEIRTSFAKHDPELTDVAAGIRELKEQFD